MLNVSLHHRQSWLEVVYFFAPLPMFLIAYFLVTDHVPMGSKLDPILPESHSKSFVRTDSLPLLDTEIHCDSQER